MLAWGWAGIFWWGLANVLGAERTPDTLPEVLTVVSGAWVYVVTTQVQIVVPIEVTVRSRRQIVAA